ncbi:hypothetical protein FRC08_002573 [Ceratobasidium sp. 394]|nr:hypothetical protein FRC08_002573 [Ceratobasidium sp. 394]
MNVYVRTKTGIAHSAKLELRIRELIARENVRLTQMEHEISLMPKPTRLYCASAESVQRIADLVSGLRRIRETCRKRRLNRYCSVPRATDIGYAVAEQEVREEMIEALEVLIDVTRALFERMQGHLVRAGWLRPRTVDE